VQVKVLWCIFLYQLAESYFREQFN